MPGMSSGMTGGSYKKPAKPVINTGPSNKINLGSRPVTQGSLPPNVARPRSIGGPAANMGAPMGTMKPLMKPPTPMPEMSSPINMGGPNVSGAPKMPPPYVEENSIGLDPRESNGTMPIGPKINTGPSMPMPMPMPITRPGPGGGGPWNDFPGMPPPIYSDPGMQQQPNMPQPFMGNPMMQGRMNGGMNRRMGGLRGAYGGM